MHKILFLLALPALLTAQPIVVQPDYQSTKVKKGYHLIFSDEFEADTLNLRHWDRSTSNQPDDTPCGFYHADAMLGMVSVKDGICIIKAEKATKENSNCPLQPDCDRAIGGEIKTFTWRESARTKPDAPNHFFENYTMPVGSYIEARLKAADPDCNVGSAFWLTGNDQEIDIFEVTRGAKYQFTCGYFSGRYMGGKYRDTYQRNRNIWHKATFQAGRFPKITESKIELDSVFRMHEQFAVYGVHYTTDSIHFYLNDVRYFGYALSDFQRGTGRQLTAMTPKNIRFSNGQLTGGGHVPCSMPCASAQLEVDFVRVYYPDNQKVIFWFGDVLPVKRGSSAILKATHNPAVRYKYTSDVWLIEPEWKGAPDAYVQVTARAGMPAGVYPVRLVCTFPDGHEEVLTRDLELVE
jgi:hypothetical protein